MGSGGVAQCIRDVTLYLVFLIAVSTLGPLQYGFHLAELNAPHDVITCHKKSVSVTRLVDSWAGGSALPDCIAMNENQFAIVSSIFTLGGLLGALSAGSVSTKYGRLVGMRLSTIFYILGSSLETAAPNIPVISIGRLLSGVGSGASLVVVPIYISEVAPPHESGLFGMMTQVTINLGIIITQVLGYYFSKASKWRIILGAGVGIGLFQFLGLFLIPETPAWIAANRDPRLAIRILKRIRGAGIDTDEEVRTWGVALPPAETPEAEGLLSGHQSNSRPSSSNKSQGKTSHVGFFQILRDPLYRPAVIAVVGAMVAQQLCGINSVMMYSVSLLSDLFPSTSALLTILISVVNFVMTVLCAPLPDRLGRKTCLLLSISGMGGSALALAFSILFAVKVLSVVSVLLFVASFGIGLGAIPFILASELVGQEAKGATQSWALAANWIATFLVAQFFPMINNALGGRGFVYFIFAGFALLSAVFVAWRIPETKGKRDADEVWGRTRRVD